MRSTMQEKAKKIEAHDKRNRIGRDHFVPGFQFFWNLLGPSFIYTYSMAEHFGANSHGYLSVNNHPDVVSIEFKREGFRAFAMKGGFLLDTEIKFHELTPIE